MPVVWLPAFLKSVNMLRLDGNNRHRISDLASYVSCCIIDYCIPAEEIARAKELDEEHNTTQNIIKLYKKAEIYCSLL